MILVLGLTGCIANQEPQVENQAPEELEVGNFKYDEELYAYYGKALLRGYVSLSERPQAFCQEDCPVFTYASFNILETENEFIDDYISGQKGNSFVGEMEIGLGCTDDNILWRMNDSNEFGMKKYTNSPETSEAILNATKENPITVNLERYLYTGGRGAPDCYSHFAQVSLVE